MAEHASDTRDDVALTVYSNKEGRLRGMEPNVLTDLDDIVLFGSVVIIGTNHGTPVGLTDDETAQVSIARRREMPLPVLAVSAEDGSVFFN